MRATTKILVAGNDATDRRRVTLLLHEHHPDVIVEEAASCHEVMEAIVSGQFDCVLLDYNLPDGNGLSCISDMRGVEIMTPVVLLTTQDDEILALATLKAGASDHLPKSDLTAQTLNHCLRRALRLQQAQEEIKWTQEALSLRDRAIAAASNGIVICDCHQPDCPIIYSNPAFTAITGYSAEETVGRNCRFLQGESTDPQTVKEMSDAIREERECQVILRNHRKDGTAWWNELTMSPVRNADGALTHYIGVLTDITERRNAEEALRQNVSRQHALMRDVFASVTEGKLTLCNSEEDLPAPLDRFADPVFLSAKGGIRELRRQTMSACITSGVAPERCEDLEVAIGEAAMNAVVHASTGMGQVFTEPGGTVQVRVEDAGSGISVADLPYATLRRGYSTAGTMGHGFKMMLKTVDRVYLLTRSEGTTVVIEQGRDARQPIW